MINYFPHFLQTFFYSRPMYKTPLCINIFNQNLSLLSLKIILGLGYLINATIILWFFCKQGKT